MSSKVAKPFEATLLGEQDGDSVGECSLALHVKPRVLAPVAPKDQQQNKDATVTSELDAS